MKERSSLKPRRPFELSPMRYLPFLILPVLVVVSCEPGPPRPAFGEKGYLRAGSSGVLWVSTSPEILDAFTEAAIKHDDYGVTRLINSGAVLEVSQRTRVLMIDSSLSTSKIRVLDGRHKGRLGWVPREWVFKSHTPQETKPQWHEGGTLYNATVAEWKTADIRNQIATCANIVARSPLARGRGVGSLVNEACDLRGEIDKAIEDAETVDKGIAEIAAICIARLSQ